MLEKKRNFKLQNCENEWKFQTKIKFLYKIEELFVCCNPLYGINLGAQPYCWLLWIYFGSCIWILFTVKVRKNAEQKKIQILNVRKKEFLYCRRKFDLSGEKNWCSVIQMLHRKFKIKIRFVNFVNFVKFVNKPDCGLYWCCDNFILKVREGRSNFREKFDFKN